MIKLPTGQAKYQVTGRSRIRDYHGGVQNDASLPECYAASSGKFLKNFRRNAVPPSCQAIQENRLILKHYASPKCRHLPVHTALHPKIFKPIP